VSFTYTLMPLFPPSKRLLHSSAQPGLPFPRPFDDEHWSTFFSSLGPLCPLLFSPADSSVRSRPAYDSLLLRSFSCSQSVMYEGPFPLDGHFPFLSPPVFSRYTVSPTFPLINWYDPRRNFFRPVLFDTLGMSVVLSFIGRRRFALCLPLPLHTFFL